MHEISLWLESMGIPPLLGGLFVGVAMVWVFTRLASGDKSATVLGARTRPDLATGKSGTVNQNYGMANQFGGDSSRPHNASVDLTEQDLSEIFQQLQQGEQIAAIKLLRERTGLGLAEAKWIVGDLENSGAKH